MLVVNYVYIVDDIRREYGWEVQHFFGSCCWWAHPFISWPSLVGLCFKHLTSYYVSCAALKNEFFTIQFSFWQDGLLCWVAVVPVLGTTSCVYWVCSGNVGIR